MRVSNGRSDRSGVLAGGPIDRLLGRWSARVIAALSVPYAITMVLGFSSMGNLRDPLPDPYLGVAETLIILMAPFMVTLIVAVHACAPVRLRALSLTAVGWMMMLAAVTMTVHFVELTFVRRINPADIPGFDRLLNFQWPSLLYATDIAAWDVFLGLALLFAAPVFTGRAFTAPAVSEEWLEQPSSGTFAPDSHAHHPAILGPMAGASARPDGHMQRANRGGRQTPGT